MSKKFGKKSACLLIGGSFLLSGNCVPDNFWIRTVDSVLSTASNRVAGAVVDLYIVDPLLEAVQPAEDDE